MDPFADVTDHRLTNGFTGAWSPGTERGDPGRRAAAVPTPCCHSMRADRSPWRSGAGSSRPSVRVWRLTPPRQFGEHADDVAAILDHLRPDRVHMLGERAAPHELS